jgi:UDP-N-acetylglucosamine acyltransferase
MIDSLAVVDSSAIIAEDAEIGPFNVIGPNVEIGSGTIVGPHNVIKGPTKIGKNNQILQFCSIGEDTPDLKYKGEDTRLIIGDDNVIREGVTIHRGTVQDRSETFIGNKNLIMAYVHIGHDSIVQNNTILVNNVALAGHVGVGEWAIISGFTSLHQYCNVGAHSFIGAHAWITQDVPAYVMVAGSPAKPRTINSEGLRRREFSSEQIRCLQRAYKSIYRKGLELTDAIALLKTDQKNEVVLQPLIDSLANSERGILR